MKKAICVFCLLLFGISLEAQNLVRGGYFGFYPQPVSPAVAQSLGMDKAQGVILAKIIPNSTASEIGLKVNDILLKVNEVEIESVSQIFEVSKLLKAKQALTLKILRDGQALTLQGQAKARPYETSQTGEIIYDEVAFDGGYLRSIITKPQGEGSFPTIFFIQGYTCGSIEYVQGNNPFKKLIEGLVAKGYAVFRVEKPGVGDSENDQPCEQIGFDQELAAFTQAYEQLKTYAFVDPANIFIYGHSLGGIIAPILAQKYKPKGVMVYGTVLRPWYEYLMDVVRYQQPLMGADYADVENNVNRCRPVLYEFLYEGKSPEEVTQDPLKAQILSSSFSYNGGNQFLNRHYRFWQELNRKNLVEAWKNVEAKVLAVYGSADVAALFPNDHERIIFLVNQYHAGNGTFQLLEGTDHALIKVGTQQNKIQLQASKQYGKVAQTAFNEAYIQLLSDWMA